MSLFLLAIFAWHLIGLGVWVMAMATDANDRSHWQAYALMPVVCVTWPYLLWSAWEVTQE